MKVLREVDDGNGGAVELSKEHGVTASYRVGRVAALPPSDLLNVYIEYIKLPNGRTVSLFVNRESGLVVVDVNHANGKGGNEVLRVNANEIDLSHCEPKKRKKAA